jgi:ribosome-binding protein aMBF1 (putative translation factor)
MKCELCGADIKEGALGKIRGTYIVKGRKKLAVCSGCQKSGKNLKETLAGKL